MRKLRALLGLLAALGAVWKALNPNQREEVQSRIRQATDTLRHGGEPDDHEKRR